MLSSVASIGPKMGPERVRRASDSPAMVERMKLRTARNNSAFVHSEAAVAQFAATWQPAQYAEIVGSRMLDARQAVDRQLVEGLVNDAGLYFLSENADDMVFWAKQCLADRDYLQEGAPMGRLYTDSVWMLYMVSLRNLFARMDLVATAQLKRQQTLSAGARFLAEENVQVLKRLVIAVHSDLSGSLGRRFSDAVQTSANAREALEKVWFNNKRSPLDYTLRWHPEVMELAERAYAADERRRAAALNRPRVLAMWDYFTERQLYNMYPPANRLALPRYEERVRFMQENAHFTPEEFADWQLQDWKDVSNTAIYRHVHQHIRNAFREAIDAPVPATDSEAEDKEEEEEEDDDNTEESLPTPIPLPDDDSPPASPVLGSTS